MSATWKKCVQHPPTCALAAVWSIAQLCYEMVIPDVNAKAMRMWLHKGCCFLNTLIEQTTHTLSSHNNRRVIFAWNRMHERFFNALFIYIVLNIARVLEDRISYIEWMHEKQSERIFVCMKSNFCCLLFNIALNLNIMCGRTFALRMNNDWRNESECMTVFLTHIAL